MFYWIGLVYLGLCGAVAGSAIVTFRDRLERHDSLVTRSKCVDCGHVLAPWELLPVVAYLALRGHCRYCGGAIPQSILESEIHFTLIGVSLYLGVMAWANIF